MESDPKNPQSIDEYIAGFPPDVRNKLEAMREVIKRAAPQAQEAISYRMPTFRLHGNLVHFAAFSHHIGFYPTPSGIVAFKTELSRYKGAKGSVQFPLDEALPLDLIARITRFRVAENLKAFEAKKRQKG
jgi:uncharacterized protein YdhG (YjbR/CyaY superfamily)